MINIVGGGKMGSAIAAGLIAQGKDITIVVRTDASVTATKDRFPQATVKTTNGPCDGAIICVKPKDVTGVIETVVAGGAQRVLSVAAGITTSRLHAAAGQVPSLRSMPNVGAFIGQSATALCTTGAQAEDLDWAESVLQSLGLVVRVTEEQIDGATGLAGSGPAYLFLVTEALIDAGVHAGLSRDVSKQFTVAMLQGATALLENHEPAALREMVTSPAGTTAAGLRVLEDRGVRAAFIAAVNAAAERSRELGK